MKLTTRHSENPFTKDGMKIETRNKSIRLGKESEVSIVNDSTGEITTTHVATYKQVDNAQFVKLFTQNISMTFDLTSAGNKALGVVINIVQNTGQNKDKILITEDEVAEFNITHDKKISMDTFYRGIRELEKAQIIARTTRNSVYFINPNFIFNGDRIAFTQIIERKKQTTIEDFL
jgi:hypothetical protein